MTDVASTTQLEEEIVEDAAPIGLPWRLLVFSIILFGFAFSIYFGLRFGYTAYLHDRATMLDGQIRELGNQISSEEQNKFIRFYSQLANVKNVLDRHIFSGNTFAFLEKNTLPAVYFTEGMFLAEREEIKITGSADTMETLIGQLTIFEQAPELKNATLDTVSFDKERVNFAMTMHFMDDFFKLPK